MKNNFFYFLSKDNYYKNFEKIYRKSVKSIIIRGKIIGVLFYILSLIIVILEILSLIGILTPISFGKTLTERIFRFVMLSFILAPLIILMGHLFFNNARQLELATDMWVNKEGIHLPSPVGKENKYFIKFDEVSKIIVWKHPKEDYRTVITIYLSSKFKRRFPFEPNNRVGIVGIESKKFIEAVKKASENKIKIEFRGVEI